MNIAFDIVGVSVFFTSVALAVEPVKSPQGMERSYAHNYKDMVFATCIANAYKDEKSSAIDSGSSASALRDWTYYDLEKSPDKARALVNKYVARNYQNPLVESEVKGVRFDLLKCLDLYHSKELDSLAHKLVINPKHTYKQDNNLP